MTDEIKKRTEELALRSLSRGIYTYGDFLGADDAEELTAMRLPAPVRLFGGADFCERKMPRFGSPETLGYDEPFPLSIIKITPSGAEFNSPLTHRDFLGSLLGLGIDHGKTGDIFTDGRSAYAVVNCALVAFITQNLVKCGRYAAKAEVAQTIPDELAPKFEERIISVSSVRLDAILCRVFNLSREDGAELFKEGRVFSRGRQIDSPSYRPSDGDAVSVRGYGKLIACGKAGTSAKGKTRYSVKIYK